MAVSSSDPLWTPTLELWTPPLHTVHTPAPQQLHGWAVWGGDRVLLLSLTRLLRGPWAHTRQAGRGQVDSSLWREDSEGPAVLDTRDNVLWHR